MFNKLSSVSELLQSAGDYLLEVRAKNRVSIVDQKVDGPVSTADLFVQEFISKNLRDKFPEIPIIGEESVQDWRLVIQDAICKDNFVWILDPLDGTSLYLSGSENFGIQLALAKGNKIIAGWIHCPALEITVSAWDPNPDIKAQGMNHVNNPAPTGLNMTKAVIASGDFEPNHLEKVKNLKPLLAKSRGTNSCAVDYVELISGKQDILLYRRTYPWDHAPGAYLAKVNGAVVHRFDGLPYSLKDGQGGLIVMRCPESLDYEHLFLPILK